MGEQRTLLAHFAHVYGVVLTTGIHWEPLSFPFLPSASLKLSCTVALHNAVTDPTFSEFLSHSSDNVASLFLRFLNSVSLFLFIDLEFGQAISWMGTNRRHLMGVGRTNEPRQAQAQNLRRPLPGELPAVSDYTSPANFVGSSGPSRNLHRVRKAFNDVRDDDLQHFLRQEGPKTQ